MSIPPWLLQFLVAGLVVFWGLWGVLILLRAFVPDPFGHPEVVIGFVVAWIVLTVLWVRRAPSERGSAWEFVPSWQYTGRFAQSGGLTRDEMETALPDDSEDEQ